MNNIFKYEVRPAFRFEDKYTVSNTGKVFFEPYTNPGYIREVDQQVHEDEAKCKAPWVLIHYDGRYHRVYVHKLVLRTFVPNPENYTHAEHIDGNVNNNRVSNLRWIPGPDDKNASNSRKKNDGECIFKNIDTGAVYIGTPAEFRDAYNLNLNSVYGIVNGTRKSTKGWIYVVGMKQLNKELYHSGNKHTFQNKDIAETYTFQNKGTGETYVGSGYGFCDTYNLPSEKVAGLIRNDYKFLNDWKIV